MSNIVSYIPLPAILLLLFLVINVGVIVVVRRRFSAREAEHPKPEPSKAPEEKTAEPIKVDKSSSPSPFYILGVFSWFVLLWPIVLFLQTKTQMSSRSFLPEDGVKSDIQPLSQEQCDRITFFDVEAREILVEGLSDSFLPGDVLLIGVGSREGEEAEKARVRINSSVWTDDNEIHEKSLEGLFILECPIDALSDGRPTVCGMPIEKRGKFAVEAEIYDAEGRIWK